MANAIILSPELEGGLQVLLSAKNKQQINEYFLESFNTRNDNEISEDFINKVIEEIEVDEERATAMISSCQQYIRLILYHGIEKVLFSDDFNVKLKKLVVNIVGHHLPSWRKSVIDSQPHLPYLEEINWRIDMKTASDLISSIQIPSCIVSLKVRDDNDQQNPVHNVQFELSKETLSTVLDGLGNIRNQLSALNR
eukprot:TRINITY_DN16762_c0_g1_i1.p1 TRINITY_DN16762_c0_g1~~TRINITY_DN16762_c0_g1_i1.p1  ORF type:complete len:195 (+),score=59.64 TRINITY_DN16762_c0_g1_i1:59-643(+)